MDATVSGEKQKRIEMPTKTWSVKSSKNPEVTYTVTMVEAYHWECTCPYFVMRHVECKHITMIRGKYDQQHHEGRPPGDAHGSSTLPGDDRGSGQEGNPVPSGEFRGSDLNPGDSAGDQPGNEPGGEGRPSSGSGNPETGMGTPDADSLLPGSTEGIDPATPDGDPGIRPEDIEKQRITEERNKQSSQYETWKLRETSYSKNLHQRLQELRVEYKTASELRKRQIKTTAECLKISIRVMNAKDKLAVPDFDISLLNIEPEEITQEMVNIQSALF